MSNILNKGVNLLNLLLFHCNFTLLLLNFLFKFLLFFIEPLLHLLEHALLLFELTLQFLFFFALFFEEFIILNPLILYILVRLILQVFDLSGPQLKVWIGDNEVTFIADVVLLGIRLAEILLVLEASGADRLAAATAVVPRSIGELLEGTET